MKGKGRRRVRVFFFCVCVVLHRITLFGGQTHFGTHAIFFVTLLPAGTGRTGEVEQQKARAERIAQREDQRARRFPRIPKRLHEGGSPHFMCAERNGHVYSRLVEGRHCDVGNSSLHLYGSHAPPLFSKSYKKNKKHHSPLRTTVRRITPKRRRCTSGV